MVGGFFYECPTHEKKPGNIMLQDPVPAIISPTLLYTRVNKTYDLIWPIIIFPASHQNGPIIIHIKYMDYIKKI